ncbi:MAG: 30S ribosomal protein S6 [Clostridiales Family XIII bacterium]|jgi:small subunit ribosomal protein S6|nr:30S ribosomal protein S6 [Clostridiales Family XIII bacterium]
MNHYEVMVVFTPEPEAEKNAAAVEAVSGIITGGGGTIIKTDAWGMRKLAYPIKKKNEGYYAVIEFDAAAELPKELDRRLRISDSVLRHLIIAKDEKEKAKG